MREATKEGSNLYEQGGTAHTDEQGRLYKERRTAHTDQQGALRAKERLRSTRSREKTKATRRRPHFGDIASLCIEPGRGAFRLDEEKEGELPTGVLRPLTTRR